MADKGQKIVTDIIKAVEGRIVKLEKELKSQQEVIKNLVICINDLSNIVKNLPEKQIRKLIAFKYPFPTREIGIDLGPFEASTQILSANEKLEQVSELSVSENEEFSLSIETVEILENL